MLEDQNFTLEVGDYKLLEITVLNDLGHPHTGLHDGILKWEIYALDDLETAIKTKTSADQGINVTHDGLVEVAVMSSDTSEFDPGVYTHKLYLTRTLGGEAICETAATGVITMTKNGSEYVS